MRSHIDEPHEAWGVLNPGGVRGPDGLLHLFPRLIAEGNYSRISVTRECFSIAISPSMSSDSPSRSNRTSRTK